MGLKHSKYQQHVGPAAAVDAGLLSHFDSPMPAEPQQPALPTAAAQQEPSAPTAPAKHFLFIIGPGMLLPLGQEPYASFQVTRVTSGPGASRCSSTSSLTGVGGSSPRGCSPPRNKGLGYSTTTIPEQAGACLACSNTLGPSPQLFTDAPSRKDPYIHSISPRSSGEAPAVTGVPSSQGLATNSVGMVPAQGLSRASGGFGAPLGLNRSSGGIAGTPFGRGNHAVQVVSNTLRHQKATSKTARAGFTCTAIVSALDLNSVNSLAALSSQNFGLCSQQASSHHLYSAQQSGLLSGQQSLQASHKHLPPQALGSAPLDMCPQPIRVSAVRHPLQGEPLTNAGSTVDGDSRGSSPGAWMPDTSMFLGGAAHPPPSPFLLPPGEPIGADPQSPLSAAPCNMSPTSSIGVSGQSHGHPSASHALGSQCATPYGGSPRGGSPPPAMAKRTSLSGQMPVQPLSSLVSTLSQLRAACPSLFIILWHPAATEDAEVRAAAFAAGANMVTCSQKDLQRSLTRIACQSCQGNITCAWCGQQHLSTRDYWVHQPLYHIAAPERPTWCHVCQKDVDNLAVHIHETHAPSKQKPEARTNYGSAVVVHRPSDNKFLMVQEFAGQGFWTPGGCADPGESLAASAVRECLEETGVDVEVKGLLEVQHDMSATPPWRLAVFYAQPKDINQVPKTTPDFESAGACWVSVDQLASIPLRDAELPIKWYTAVVQGTAQLLPLQTPAHAQREFHDLKMC